MADLLPGNEFFQGGLALALMGGAVALIRYLPILIWSLIQRRWSVTVTIRDQELIQWIGAWMATTPYGQRCQWLEAGTDNRNPVPTPAGNKSENGSDSLITTFWPGMGHHVFRHEGRRYWLDIVLEDQGVAGKIRVATIRTLGRDLSATRVITEWGHGPGQSQAPRPCLDTRQ